MSRFSARIAVVLSLGLALSPAATVRAGQTPAPVHVGGDVKPPAKVKDAKPVYPEEARRAKVQGVVITEATVGVDGKVTSIKVLRPIPMLNDAAVKAVQAQVYKPTLINGVATPIIMTVPVIFSLD